MNNFDCNVFSINEIYYSDSDNTSDNELDVLNANTYINSKVVVDIQDDIKAVDTVIGSQTKKVYFDDNVKIITYTRNENTCEENTCQENTRKNFLSVAQKILLKLKKMNFFKKRFIFTNSLKQAV